MNKQIVCQCNCKSIEAKVNDERPNLALELTGSVSDKCPINDAFSGRFTIANFDFILPQTLRSTRQSDNDWSSFH